MIVQLGQSRQNEPLDLIWLTRFLKHFYADDLFGPSVDQSCRAVIAENRRKLLWLFRSALESNGSAAVAPTKSNKIVLHLDHLLCLEASRDDYAKPRTLTFLVRRYKDIKQGYLQRISGSAKAGSNEQSEQPAPTGNKHTQQQANKDIRVYANNELSTTFLLEGLLGVSAKYGKAILERKTALPDINQTDELTAQIIFHALLVSPITKLANLAGSKKSLWQTDADRKVLLEVIGNDLALQKHFFISLLEKLLSSTMLISDSFTLLSQSNSVIIDRVCLCADIERFLTWLDHLAIQHDLETNHFHKQEDCLETDLAQSTKMLQDLLQRMVRHALHETNTQSVKSSSAAGLSDKLRLKQLLSTFLDADRACQDITTLIGILAAMEKKQIECTPQMFQSLCTYLKLSVDATQTVMLLSGQVTAAPFLPSFLLTHFILFSADDGASGAFRLKSCPPSLAAAWSDYFFTEDHSHRGVLFRQDLAELPDLAETLLKKTLAYAEPFRPVHLNAFTHPTNGRAIRIRSDLYRWTIAFDYRPMIRQGMILAATPEYGGVYFSLAPPLSAVADAELRFRIASADLTKIKIEIKNAGRKLQFDHHVTLEAQPTEYALALNNMPADISSAIEEIVFLVTVTEFIDTDRLQGELILEDVRIG